jgi:hypothetical protein
MWGDREQAAGEKYSFMGLPLERGGKMKRWY